MGCGRLGQFLDREDVNLVAVLLASPFLTLEGQRAVKDFLTLSAPLSRLPAAT